jgi:hypothetical protein
MKAFRAWPITVIALFGFSAFPALADYHYASHEGSNEYPYTSWETAAHLIQDALDAAEPHDTVYIGTGSYYERVHVRRDSLAMIGMGMDSTRIWWDGYHETVIYLDSTAYLADLTLETDPPYATSLYGAFFRRYIIERCRFEGGGAYVSGAGGHIKNCIFDGMMSGVGTTLTGLDYLEVSNCFFTTTGRTPIRSAADTNIVVNNIINAHAPSGRGFYLFSGQIYSFVANNLLEVWGPSSGMTISTPESEELWFINNSIDTLYRWQREMWYGLSFSRSDGSVVIRNNAITGGEDCGIYLVSENMTLDARYNNVWGTDQTFLAEPSSSIDTSEGFLKEYPMFNKGDGYRLQAYSPLIDTGDPDIFDVDGTRSDIGCYGGPGGCSYVYLDLAPLIPDSITVEMEEDMVIINWRFNAEADFNRYQVFRDTVSGFEPSEINMIAEPDSSYYADETIEPGTAYYYRLTSVDNQGNVSDYSEEVAVIPTDIVHGDGPSIR